MNKVYETPEIEKLCFSMPDELMKMTTSDYGYSAGGPDDDIDRNR